MQGGLTMKVCDLMHTGVECAEPDTSIRKIAKKMRDSDIGVVPVRENAQLVGIITDRDIATRAVANGKDIGKLSARDVMSKGVFWCRDTATAAQAAKLMRSKKVRRLPVLDGEKNLVGMLSLGDISQALSTAETAKVVKALTAHHR
jgi:CBS domain-containing protein